MAWVGRSSSWSSSQAHPPRACGARGGVAVDNVRLVPLDAAACVGLGDVVLGFHPEAGLVRMVLGAAGPLLVTLDQRGSLRAVHRSGAEAVPLRPGTKVGDRVFTQLRGAVLRN